MNQKRTIRMRPHAASANTGIFQPELIDLSMVEEYETLVTELKNLLTEEQKVFLMMKMGLDLSKDSDESQI